MNRREHLLGLQAYLEACVLGQTDAVARVSRALEASALGLNDTGPRPRASFLFMGGSGVGKTELTKAFSEYLFGPERFTMLFMNQYQAAADLNEVVHTIKRAVDAHPEGVTFLFDEIEKAHRSITDLFLSLLDEGAAALPGGERVSISRCVVVMTSNLGAKRWAQMQQTKYAVMQTFACNEARRHLRPELANRLTEVVVFRPLSLDAQIQILAKVVNEKLRHLEERFLADLGRPVALSIDERGVYAHLLPRCFTSSGGVRQLREELNRQFNPGAQAWLLQEKAPPEGRFYRCYQTDSLVLR